MVQAAIQGSGEYVTALRNGKLLAQRLMRAPEPLHRPVPGAAHTHLVTGGSRGLGLEYAKHAMKSGSKCIVLASRSPQLDPAELAALADGSGQRAVFTVRCDAGSPDELARVLEWAREQLPAVQAVAHAAGALGQVELIDYQLCFVQPVVLLRLCIQNLLYHAGWAL